MKKDVALLHNAYPSSLRDYVEQRLDGLGRFNERMTAVRAVLDHQHNDHRVELVASIGGSGPLVVEAMAHSPRLALKHALASLTTSLKRQRTKFLDSRHHAGPPR